MSCVELAEEEWQKATDAAAQYARNNPIIVNKDGSTIGEVQAKKDLKFKCFILFRDHLQLNVTWMEEAFQNACHENGPPRRLHRTVVSYSCPEHIVVATVFLCSGFLWAYDPL
jgi:hypothetical protein